MDLDEYMWRNKLTFGDVAKVTGMSPTTLFFARKKTYNLKLENAIMLNLATNGQVNFLEMVTAEVKKNVLERFPNAEKIFNGKG